ncbi:sialidase domain-containing protein [Cytophagaceae bacterium DM2B3-1]|uniref:Sialidase domain-containing protein n=1 Tax=Xanthocytophaga flava TaxID=3048013 RepID=A0ABT7D0G1_9BACT|nr:hypothetical protein [Xanthocytophaga flavus]MDJ1498652.1 sialidase domain-containing protein [Xanthocytophaga flavus]
MNIIYLYFLKLYYYSRKTYQKPNSAIWRIIVCLGFFLHIPKTDAQNGPGGIGDASTNQLWLDASKLSFSSTTKITEWTDVSGNGLNAKQAALQNLPSFVPNVLNGKPVIRFSRSTFNTYLEVSGSSTVGTLFSNSNTIFAVAKAITGATSSASSSVGLYQSILTPVGYHSGIHVGGYPTATNIYYVNWLGGTIGGSPAPSTGNSFTSGYTQGNWFLATLKNQESASATTTSAYLNSNQVGSTTSNLLMTNYNNNLVRIGAANTSGDYSWGLNGDIAEIIVYNTALNPTQQFIVETYLATKYNLPFRTEYYSVRDGSFTGTIQGIGTLDGTEKNSSSSLGNFTLAEINNSLNSPNEFLFAGSQLVPVNTTTSDVAASVMQRSEKIWYLQKTGKIDASLTFTFDLPTSSFPPNNYPAKYCLLYRSDQSKNFTIVTTPQGLPLQPTVRTVTITLPFTSVKVTTHFLKFNVTDGTVASQDLVSGYYTIGRIADKAIWKANAISSEWNNIQNWEAGQVPTLETDVVINTCSICPILPANVSINTLSLNTGSVLDLKGYILTATKSLDIRQCTLKNTASQGGILRAFNINEVTGSVFSDQMTIEKTGGQTNTWSGGNLFKKRITILNQVGSTAPINMAAQADDIAEQ